MNASHGNGGRERRRHMRVRLSVAATLEAPPRAPRACEIYDMSVGGALLHFSHGLGLGQKVILHVEDLGALAGHIARVSSTVVAIAFDDPDPAALARFIVARTEDKNATAEALQAPEQPA